MRKSIVALAFGVAALATPAGAQVYDHSTHLPGMNHGMLASSDPSDGAVLDQAPQALTLNFQHAVTLQSITIASGDATPTALTWRRSEHPARSYSISLPALTNGAHEIAFTAAGTGGSHTMSGRIRFTVR